MVHAMVQFYIITTSMLNSSTKIKIRGIRYMGFPFTPFRWHGKCCFFATFLGVEHLFLCLQKQNTVRHTWCFGLLKELCVLLTFNLVLNTDCCGPTHLPQRLQKMFIYTLLYPVIQQFCSNALTHCPLGVACNISHHCKGKWIQHGEHLTAQGWAAPRAAAGGRNSKREEPTCDGKHIIHGKASIYSQQHQSSGNLELAFS